KWGAVSSIGRVWLFVVWRVGLFLFLAVLFFGFPVEFVFEYVQFFELLLPGLKPFLLPFNIFYDLLYQGIVLRGIGEKLQVVLQLPDLGLALVNFPADKDSFVAYGPVVLPLGESLDLVPVFNEFRFLFADPNFLEKGIHDFAKLAVDVFLVVGDPTVLLPLVEKSLDVRKVLLFVPAQLIGLQAVQAGIFLVEIRIFILLCLGPIGMQPVEVMVAGLLELLPDLIGIFSGHMANGFPFALNALHFRGGRFPVLTVL